MLESNKKNQTDVRNGRLGNSISLQWYYCNAMQWNIKQLCCYVVRMLSLQTIAT